MFCKKCGEKFQRYINVDGTIRDLNSRKFCLKCSPFKAHNTRDLLKKKSVCMYCGEGLNNWQKSFCNQKCKNGFYYDAYIKKWKSGKESGLRGEYGVSKNIKRYILNKYNNKCSICGWDKVNATSGKIPLEIHHIDGDYKNNKEENLTALCPNCHSLTPTYKKNNRNGRKLRSKYGNH
jgi:hypothetical protein